jgi:hypothetical protein
MSDIFDQMEKAYNSIQTKRRIKFTIVNVALTVMEEVGTGETDIARRVLASDVLYNPDRYTELFVPALLSKYPTVDPEQATGDQMKTGVTGIWNAFALNRDA